MDAPIPDLASLERKHKERMGRSFRGVVDLVADVERENRRLREIIRLLVERGEVVCCSIERKDGEVVGYHARMCNQPGHICGEVAGQLLELQLQEAGK